MSRIGLKPSEESLEMIDRISSLPGLFIEGLFTHFPRADEEDKAVTKRQFEDFRNFAGSGFGAFDEERAGEEKTDLPLHEQRGNY